MRPAAIAALCLMLAGCERGCAWTWLREHGAGARAAGESSGQASWNASTSAVDCPDGLARCEEGTVLVSRLAVIPLPCRGPEGACRCPWERLGLCERGCASDAVEIDADRSKALTQLCAPPTDARPVVEPLPPGARAEVRSPGGACDEGQLYRCAGGEITDCVAHAAVASCVRGCFEEGAAIDDRVQPVAREAAFAILCSR